MGRRKKSKNKEKTCDGNLQNPNNPPASSKEIADAKYPGNKSQYETEWFSCDVSPIYGRYLKAKKAIKKGTLVLTEKYLIAGPQRSSDIVCVGCHSEFQSVNDRKACPKCSWPICSLQCADSPFHKNECKFFVENHSKPPTRYGNSEFGALTVLRGLMLKYQNPEAWKNLLDLEAHNEIRKATTIWRENTINVVDIILKSWKFGNLFTEEEAHTVCGILEVNAFELGEKSSYRGIYPISAMLAHDCIPNTTRFENPVTGVLAIRVAVDIQPGEALTICYAYSLEATNQRRSMLSETKFFECFCKRCCDPRECGLNLGTLICQNCHIGDVINMGANDLTQNWTCQSCGIKVPYATIEAEQLKWQPMVDRVIDIPSSEQLLKSCRGVFHSTHYIPFDVKFNVCQAYGREAAPLDALSPTELDRKIELCKEVMKVLDIATPGFTVTRGLVLYELQAAETIKARTLQGAKKSNAAMLRRKLQVVLKILQESITILEFCHPSSIEYEISQAAKAETLVDLNKWISILK